MWAPVVKRLGRFCPLLLPPPWIPGVVEGFRTATTPLLDPLLGALSPTSGACPVCRNLVVPFQLLSGLVPRLGVRHQMQHALRATQGKFSERPHLRERFGSRTKPWAGHAPPGVLRAPSAPPAGGLAGVLPGLLGLQHSAIRNHSMVQIAPQRDQQFARQGHDPHPPRTAASRPIPFLKP